MPDPFDTNDDWAELARELERDKPPAPPLPPVPADPVEAEAADPRSEDETDEEFDDAEESSSGEPTADGEQPGTGRKRRRRRRRRRKGGAQGEAAPVADTDGEVEAGTDEEPALEPVAPADEGDDFDSGADESTDADGEYAPLATEEDTASDVLRDLIANWNVPSWDDIVGGLYRPN